MKLLEYKPLSPVKKTIYDASQDEMVDLAKSVAKLFGLYVDDFLGKGAFARAFLLSDGRVIKITTDVHDYNMAVRIKNMINTKGAKFDYIVQVHEAMFLKQSSLYCIITDFVQLDIKYYDEMYDRLDDLCNYVLRGYNIDKYDDEYISENKPYDILVEYLDIALELKELGFVSADLHSDNVGFTPDKKPIIFDFGCGSSDSDIPIVNFRIINI